MEMIYEKFIWSVKKNYPKNQDKIFEAYQFATDAHEGIVRKSGEPYIIHPISVAQILIDNNMDYSTIIAALLHDVVEDTEISLKTIEKKFGKTVAKLVDGVTKIASLSKTDKLNENDSIKRLLLAMGEDVRVIFIKLADRLHNMRTIEFLARHRQIAISQETQELFIPIAERIGLRNIRAELESLTFKCLNPEEYVEIKAYQDKKLAKHAKSIEEVEHIIKDALKENGIQPDVIWWPEKYYSLYKKSKVQGFGKARGLMMVRIMVPTVDDCYRTLGIIHKNFKPVPSQVKDFIASPKRNGYKSLHTLVMSKESGIVFSVMIRTPEMNNVCEYGILSFWNNKDDEEEFDVNFEKYNILKSIIYGEREESEHTTSFIDAIKTDLSSNVTWVFTPNFKPINIESNEPTALDFAYAVHTKIGHNAVGCNINGKKMSLASTLKNGDVVEIITADENKSPSRSWLKVVKTFSARKRLREYFNRNLTQENIELGKKMLSKELMGLGYELKSILTVYPEIKVEFNYSSIDDMYASIGYKGVTLQQIVGYITKNDLKNNVLKNASFEAEGVDFASSVIYSKCCCPVFGDDIVAVKSKTNLSIHTANCINLKNFEADRICKAIWKKKATELFDVNLKIVGKDSIGFGAKILQAIADDSYNLSRIVAKKINMKCEFEITLKVKDKDEISKIIEKLEKLEDVKSINRSFD